MPGLRHEPGFRQPAFTRALTICIPCPAVPLSTEEQVPTYTISPVGWIRKSDGKTFIVIDRRYQPALMGVEKLTSIWVLWWFDRNDSPDKRAILIALSPPKALSVRDNMIEIDDIDAVADTPGLNMKP